MVRLSVIYLVVVCFESLSVSLRLMSLCPSSLLTEVVQLEEQYDSGPTLTVDSEESAEVNAPQKELKHKIALLGFVRRH